MDLYTFVADKTHMEFLRPMLYLPEGNTRSKFSKGLSPNTL